MSVIFKAQVDCHKSSTIKESHYQSNPSIRAEFDWSDKALLKRCVRAQNKWVATHKFDPVKYFGGYKPHEIGTGIVRQVIKDVFTESPKMKQIKPTSETQIRQNPRPKWASLEKLSTSVSCKTNVVVNNSYAKHPQMKVSI